MNDNKSLLKCMRYYIMCFLIYINFKFLILFKNQRVHGVKNKTYMPERMCIFFNLLNLTQITNTNTSNYALFKSMRLYYSYKYNMLYIEFFRFKSIVDMKVNNFLVGEVFNAIGLLVAFPLLSESL